MAEALIFEGKSAFRWAVMTESVKGASHQQKQDAVAFRVGEGDAPPVVLAVSDGHGSPRSFRSSVGSQFAVEVATEITSNFLDGFKSASASDIKREAERSLTTKLVKGWKEKVKEHFDKEPFRDDELEHLEQKAGPSARQAIKEEFEEAIVKKRYHDDALKAHYMAYGTTLLLVAIEKRFVFYLQLGDGDILAVSDDRKVEHPLPPDETLLANDTLSGNFMRPWRYIEDCRRS